MIEFLQRLDRRDLCVLLFTLSFAGLIYSKWFLSVCLFSLIPLAFITVDWQPHFKIGIRKKSRNFIRVYLSHPPYWALGLILLVVLLSAIYTGPSDYWYSRIRIKAPLILAPFLMSFIPPLSKRHLHIWMLGSISIGLLSLIGVLGNYFMNMESINDGLRMGQAIPTPISHIRYSLFIVLCLILSLWLSTSKSATKLSNWYPRAAAIIFLIGLHILSVRSGLFAAYLVLFLGLIYLAIITKSWRLSIFGLLLLIVLPFIAVQLSPSLQTRLSYARYDINEYLKGNAKNNSDGDRLLSLKIGWQTFQENKWLGTGVANFRDEIKQRYSLQYPDHKNQKLPHNQYLSLLASVGLIGFIISIFAFLLPLFWSRQFTFFPLAAFYLVILSSMLFENTWETTVGLNLFLLPILVMLNYLSGRWRV